MSIQSPDVKVRNENRARNEPDFNQEKHTGIYCYDFKVGDQFKLQKPMFLHHSITGVVYLSPPSEIDTPSMENYRRDPNAYQHGNRNSYQVIRLASKGTIIRLVAIKDSSQAGFIPYFVFEGEDEWFRSATFRKRDGSLNPHGNTYDREYFLKLRKR